MEAITEKKHQQQNFQANIDDAKRLLERLGCRPEDTRFRTIYHDSDAGKGARNYGSDALPDQLAADNRNWWGVFVVVNATTGDSDLHVTRVRAVFVDLDGAPLEPVKQAKIQPHIIIETSPGRYHAYWLVEEGFPLEQFRPVQKAIVKRFNGDPKCVNPSRVMRLPGFVHLKTGKEPFISRIIEENDHPALSMEEVVAGLDLDIEPATTHTTRQAPHTSHHTQQAGETAYGLKALADESSQVAVTPAGERNARLNTAAFKIGRLAAGGQVDEAHAMRALLSAALDAGLSEAEATKTINSGLAAGRSNPRSPAQTMEPGGGGRHHQDDHTGQETGADPDDIEEPPELFWIPKTKPAAFPMIALPSILADAVIERHQYGGEPLSLIATSAISAASLVCQALADVARDSCLGGPLGLFLLVIADSGERKTAVDRHFAAPIREWFDEYRKNIEPDIKEAIARHLGWEAERAGIVKAITAAEQRGKEDKAGRSVEALKQRLAEHAMEEPPVVSYPYMFFSDFNAASIGAALTDGWKSAAVWTAEGGAFVGNNGSLPENLMLTLAMLNELWDCGRYENSRKVASRIDIKGARLTAGLMMQESVFQAFAEKQEGLARGIGLFSRFLITWPESAIGTRPYKKPGPMSAYEAYRRRVTEILNRHMPTDPATRELVPPVLTFSPDAKKAWVDFYDTAERLLVAGGRYHTIKDIGAKAGENCARLAAIFHMLEGHQGNIDAELVQRAATIMEFYLNEALRVFDVAEALPAEKKALALLKWVQSGHNTFNRQIINRTGPSAVRKSSDMTEALKILKGARWIQQDGKTYHLNPKANQLDVDF